MNVKNMSFDELELLSYQDIAYYILKEKKIAQTTAELFKEVCDLLNISDEQMYEMIGDFYTTLTTDKRFILVDEAKWDLKELHSVKTVVEEEDEEDEEESSEESEKEEENTETEDEAVLIDKDEYEDETDDLDDLSIVTEEELESE